MIPTDHPHYNPHVLAHLQSLRRCSTPDRHRELQPPSDCGDLCVAESLDPTHIIRYQRCGLCAGILTIQGVD